MAPPGRVLSLGLVPQDQQGGSHTLHCQLEYNHPHPQQSHSGVWAAPQPHQTAHFAALLAAPAETADSTPWMGACLICRDSSEAVGHSKGQWHLPRGREFRAAAVTWFSALCPLQISANCTVVGRRLKSGLRLKL